ncbi:DUF2959 family protein [Gayadomonas joobiniege]|uniref:DUF2959 family protein n=1 Tax=Gayadomonas joobiniege TaxID=1234606 RepID=UPI0003668305|nr:DUF2959 family protein [Gayadomonas joobiniege]
MKPILHSLFVFSILSLAGCQSAYYSAMEKVGYHKRDILVDRVEAGQEAQQEAREEFTSALEKFQSLVNFSGGDLQVAYDELNSEYEDSKDAADKVHKRIKKIEAVAEELFEEWEEELELFQNANLKNQSQQRLSDTRMNYGKLIMSMKQAENKMQPFLTALRDNVLYLKHNLNAQSMGALRGELRQIEREVDDIIQDIEKSLAQSNLFIQSLKL